MKQKNKIIPYGHQWIDEEDIDAVVKVLRSDWITQGRMVEEFEEEFAEYVGAKYAVAVNSGTAALHAACFAAGICEGDEVITTPITFVASANCVLYQGGTPVFADIDAKTVNIDPQEIKKKITSKTKAIIPVDFTGRPTDLDKIMGIAKENNLIVIEDASHALGAIYKGRKIGCISDMTVFSFHPSKHITTGEGGMITTDNKKYYERLKLFRSHGITKEREKMKNYDGDWYYEMQELGYNYRLTDFQCVLGMSQLKKIDQFLKIRRDIVQKYNREFKSIPEIIIPKGDDEEHKSAWHIYVIQLRLKKIRVSRREIFNELKKEGLGVQVHYIPIHMQPYYQKRLGYRRGDYPVAEKYYERAITLPLYPKMTDEDIRFVIKKVKKIINSYRRMK